MANNLFPAPVQAGPAWDLQGMINNVWQRWFNQLVSYINSLPSNVGNPVRGLVFPIGQPKSGVVLTINNVSGPLVIPFSCTILGWSITADNGTVTVQFWKAPAGSSIPGVGDSINTNGVSLLTNTAVESADVSDFTTNEIADGDIIIMAILAITGSPTCIVGQLKVR